MKRRSHLRCGERPFAAVLLAYVALLALASMPVRAVSGEPAPARGAAPAGEIDFARDIQPIFRDHCYECHGSEKRKGGLRLTNRGDAFTPGDLGIPVIEPKDAELSPLYELITSDDREERMPKEKHPLPPEKIERIRLWIEAGAPWPAEADDPKAHWSYQAPVRPAVPAVREASWPRNEIDRFVLARLEEEGLAPAPEADPVTLLRRVYLDLTGLPPTPGEVDAYLADESPDRWERLVDRLLASEHFGEKWARDWLDVARYADSTGFQADRLNPNWPYRDWVIRALNEDQPYDEFTVEQLAGDLLPDATIEQRVATGFNRSAPLNLEAGIHPEESRVAQVMDRVNTVGTIWLGSTIECAQCHNHKFDPFSQEEYYRLLAFFNGTPDESQVLGKLSFRPGGPNLPIPLPEAQQRERDALFAELRAFLESAGAFEPSDDPIRPKVQEAFERSVQNGSTVGVARAGGVLLRSSALDALPPKAFEEWTERMKAAIERGEPKWEVLEPVSFNATGGERARTRRNGSLLIDGAVPDTSTYVIEARTKLSGITAVRLEAFRNPELPGNGPGRGDEASPEFVVSELEVTREPTREGEEPRPIAFYRAFASHGHRDGRVPSAIDGAVDTGWSIAERYGQDHWAVFLVDDPEKIEGEYRLKFMIRQNAGFGKTIGNLRLSVTNAPADVVSLSKLQVMALEKPVEKRARGDVKRLRKQFFATRLDDVRRRLDGFLRKLPAYQKPRAPVMEELAERRETHVMKRGNYLDPGEKVAPGTPAVLPPMAEDLPRNRLGLAR
ncbi:MAG: DUF1549 domain-containing protein, partial [Deltaproteobacteria bacterium]|nr:DUF1549 domain-containing protein [Deltaproteobacteria bacterium]